jgi:hypothetical protein
MAFSHGLRYFTRAGIQISREQWMVEVAEHPRAIARDTIHEVTISTIWHGVDDALPGTDPMNYYVALDDGLELPRIHGYYLTESAALSAHRAAVRSLSDGKHLLSERELANVTPLRTREAAAKERAKREFSDIAFGGLVRVLASNWSTIVTSECASSSRPVAIVNHHLIVQVDSGAAFGSRDTAAAIAALGQVVISSVSVRPCGWA